MRFWDTSAVAALLVQEPGTPRAQALLERDAVMVVWWGTPVECWSALARLRRENRIMPQLEDEASRRLELLRTAWYEVSPSEEVRLQARRLLRIHPLGASGALQLAAALVWAGSHADAELVAFDERLCDAARLEGLLLAGTEDATR